MCYEVEVLFLNKIELWVFAAFLPCKYLLTSQIFIFLLIRSRSTVLLEIIVLLVIRGINYVLFLRMFLLSGYFMRVWEEYVLISFCQAEHSPSPNGLSQLSKLFSSTPLLLLGNTSINNWQINIQLWWCPCVCSFSSVFEHTLCKETW